jgi:hypothetical protein
VARHGQAGRLRIVAAESAPGSAAAQSSPAAVDPWRSWVFEVGLGARTGGDANYRSRNVNGSLGAQRVTEAWKFELDAGYQYNDDRFAEVEVDSAGTEIGEEVFTSLRRNWEVRSLLVKSLGPRVSAGVRAELRANTFRNIRRAFLGGPAIELNLFPYRESTRRRLTLQYGAGYEVNQYVDTTIFNRMAETLPVHYVRARYQARASWGSLNGRAEHRSYLNDGAKRRTEVGGDASVRVFRGLSVRMYGSYDWIRDQITLRKGTGDQADVLLRRRELLSGYEYNMGLGLSYTFGSIYNNVVNSRF